MTWIVNVLYIVEIVEIEGGKDNITAVEIENGELKEQLGYDAEGDFWYWGDRANGFTFILNLPKQHLKSQQNPELIK